MQSRHRSPQNVNQAKTKHQYYIRVKREVIDVSPKVIRLVSPEWDRLVLCVIPQVCGDIHTCHRVEEVHDHEVEVDGVGGRVQETSVQEDDEVCQTQGDVDGSHCGEKVLKERVCIVNHVGTGSLLKWRHFCK